MNETVAVVVVAIVGVVSNAALVKQEDRQPRWKWRRKSQAVGRTRLLAPCARECGDAVND